MVATPAGKALSRDPRLSVAREAARTPAKKKSTRNGNQPHFKNEGFVITDVDFTDLKNKRENSA